MIFQYHNVIPIEMGRNHPFLMMISVFFFRENILMIYLETYD
jgi:hypothetical protein